MIRPQLYFTFACFFTTIFIILALWQIAKLSQKDENGFFNHPFFNGNFNFEDITVESRPHQKSTGEITEKVENSNFDQNSSEIITILAWTKFFGDFYTDSFFDQSKSIDKNCLILNKCRLTNNRNLFDQSSAVIFHPRDFNHFDLPPKKLKGQKFVFHSEESPEMTYLPMKGLEKGFFDWTMTYRHDSDVFCPYGFIETRKTKIDEIPDFIKLKNKTKLIAWFVSNCHTDSKRERYIYELGKFIKIDIFGKCGQFTCPKSNLANCQNEILKHYKFYLALENAVCKDYISEKFYAHLSDSQNLMVPIVIRRSDYDHVMPKNSFISLDDFKSPKNLADFLNFLDKNDREYKKYFLWRKNYEILEPSSNGPHCFCNLCKKLWYEKYDAIYAQSGFKKSQLDIDKWWYVDNECDHKYAQKLLNNAGAA